ncbi:MAG: gamma-glutamyltransferase [Rhodospirillaceae bacterium]
MSRSGLRPLVLGALALAVAGCHTGEKPPAFFGYGAAEDALAVRAGHAVIDSGGTAVDAVVAMALTSAVTLPSRVGLGGGGLCLVYDSVKKQARTLDFLPESTLPGQAPVPAFLRGLYALQSAYGRMRWEQALGKAESLAAVGVPVSRALAADLRAAGDRLGADAGARRLFSSGGGRLLGEGEMLVQSDLAATLRTARERGVGALYSPQVTGSIAGLLAEKLGVSTATLAGYHAEWRGTAELELGHNMLHFPDRRVGGQAGLATAWAAAAPEGEDRPGWLGTLVGALGPGAGTAAPATGMIAVDPTDQAVACIFTMGGLFGRGQVVAGTGVLAAGAGGATGIGGPALVVNIPQNKTLFAGTGVANTTGEGGHSAEAALLTALHAAAVEELPGPQVLALPRAAPAPGGGVLAEAGVSPAQLGALAGAVKPAAMLGQVEAMACVYHRLTGARSCEVDSDPRGQGLHFNTLAK